MLDKYYGFIRSVIRNFPGWTIDDVLGTDRNLLMKIMMSESSEEDRKTKQEVTPLHEFIKTV